MFVCSTYCCFKRTQSTEGLKTERGDKEGGFGWSQDQITVAGMTKCQTLMVQQGRAQRSAV